MISKSLIIDLEELLRNRQIPLLIPNGDEKRRELSYISECVAAVPPIATMPLKNSHDKHETQPLILSFRRLLKL